MFKIILVGIIVALVYSQPELRLTVADWLRTASDFLIESVQVKPVSYTHLTLPTTLVV